MKKEDLLKSIGQIDDNLVEMAERGTDSKTVKQVKTVDSKQSFRIKPWLKGAACIAAAFALAIGVAGFSGAFRAGSAKKESAMDSNAAQWAANEALEAEYAFPTEQAGYGFKEEASSATNLFVNDLDASKLKAETNREKKIVYRSNLFLQTEDFDESIKQLKSFVDSMGGYFESSNADYGSYYSNQLYKSGYYVVRIPMQHYNEFMKSACDMWHVVNSSENMDDITKAYYELSDRITTLEIKELKLQELLGKATALGDIIELENQLSNNEYELNQLKNNLAGYDDKVSYATIDISLEQVTQVGNSIGSDGFGDRMKRALKNGMRNFAEGIADIVVWFGYNVIEIGIVIIALVIIRKFHLIKRLFSWIKR